MLLPLLAVEALETGDQVEGKPSMEAVDAGTGEAETSAPTGSIPDTRIGLVAGSVFEVLAPAATPENRSEPGERPLPDRPSVEWPPVVPHSIVDFIPITASENLCIDCHGVDVKEEGEPTPIPRSHYIDLRGAPGTVRESVASARWLCTSCHVSQTDAKPLVDNTVGREAVATSGSAD
jgi:nitrate reductase cytochrome c-type subunit